MGELVIKPYGKFILRTPEEVAEQKVVIHPESLNKIWPDLNPSAADRYRATLDLKAVAPKSNGRKIHPD